jgi:hypothetical protein
MITHSIQFSIPNAISPLELGQSTDGRVLGIMFKRLAIN